MIHHYHRYLLKLLIWPLMLIVCSLTGIIWLTQALRFIDFIINRGLSVWDFLQITALLVPGLLVIILPIGLFIATIFCYNKLAGDSELVVMEASGLSPFDLARPVLLVGILVSMIGYLNALFVLPASDRHFDDMQDFLKNNYSSILLQEGVFNHMTDGLTVFIRDRADDGTLHGILVQDSRDKQQAVTMMAESGRLMQTAHGPLFLLKTGLRQAKREGRITWLNFDSYNLDLTYYTMNGAPRSLSEKERYLPELFAAAKADPKNGGRFIAEAHRRLTWPLYSLGLALLAVAVLLSGQFNRRGRWKRLTLLSLCGLGVVLASFQLTNLVTRLPATFPVMYLAVFMLLGLALGWLWRDAGAHGRRSVGPMVT